MRACLCDDFPHARYADCRGQTRIVHERDVARMNTEDAGRPWRHVDGKTLHDYVEPGLARTIGVGHTGIIEADRTHPAGNDSDHFLFAGRDMFGEGFGDHERGNQVDLDHSAPEAKIGIGQGKMGAGNACIVGCSLPGRLSQRVHAWSVRELRPLPRADGGRVPRCSGARYGFR